VKIKGPEFSKIADTVIKPKLKLLTASEVTGDPKFQLRCYYSIIKLTAFISTMNIHYLSL
jgi:hypothetical protein